MIIIFKRNIWGQLYKQSCPKSIFWLNINWHFTFCAATFFKEIIKSQHRSFEYIGLSVWSRDWGSQCEIHPKSMAKQFDSGRVIDGRVWVDGNDCNAKCSVIKRHSQCCLSPLRGANQHTIQGQSFARATFCQNSFNKICLLFFYGFKQNVAKKKMLLILAIREQGKKY